MYQVLLQEVQEESLHQRRANALLLGRRFGHCGTDHRAASYADDAAEEEVCFGSLAGGNDETSVHAFSNHEYKHTYNTLPYP